VRSVEPTEKKARRKKMGKTMSQTVGGHNPRVTMVIVALAVLLLVLTLVAVVQTASTTSDRGVPPANPVMRADGPGARSVNYDPYIDRHAEVVARYHEDSLR
jgi:hypothetical protein